MNYTALKKKIKEGIDSLYIFFGEEAYLKNYTVGLLTEKTVEPDFADFNHLQLNRETLSRDAVSDFFEAFPVMAERKLLVLKDCALLDARCPDADAWIKLFSDIPEAVTVIISEDTADKRSKIYKSLKKLGTVCEFSYLERAELKSQVLKKLSAAGKNIASKELDEFLDMCSPDLTSIRYNTEKLIAYSGSRNEITHEDIICNITPPLLNRVYDISEAVMNKNADYALRLLSDLKKGGEAGVRIISVLSSYFNDLCRAAAISREGMSYADAVAAMGLPPSRRFVAERLIKRAKSVDIHFAENCLSECVKAENAIKSGLAPEWQALNMLVIKFLS